MAAVGLAEPQVAPSRVGGVGALWVIGACELEIEFEPTAHGTLVTYILDGLPDRETVRGDLELTPAGGVRTPPALHMLARLFTLVPTDEVPGPAG